MKQPSTETSDAHHLPDIPEAVSEAGIRWVRWLGKAFPAFRSRNYKLYFCGQFVSLIGTWLQIVAQGWLVLQLTNSVFLIGLVTALSTVPTLLFTLFGGLIVDRFPKKKILLYTQSISMFLALLLGTLTLLELINIWLIGCIAFCLGIVTAVDAPARQAFVAELVRKHQLSSAIALNSGTFNAARVIGPGFAGLLIGIIGTGGAFILNGISYIGVILALRMLRLKNTKIPDKTQGAFQAIREGLHYAFHHPVISMFLLMAALLSIFGWSYTTVMPLLAKNKFQVDATGLGYLYSATGIGSLLAAILAGAFSQKIRPVWFIVVGSFTFSISITLFTYTHDLNKAMLLLFFAGFGLLSQAAMINTTIQSLVRPEFRGRVMSLYVLMFLGMTPIGNLQVGGMSELFGIETAIRVGAGVIFLMGILLLLLRSKIRKAYQEYKATEQL